MQQFVEMNQPTIVGVDAGSAWVAVKSAEAPTPIIVDYDDMEADEAQDLREEEIIIDGSKFYIEVEFKTSTFFAWIRVLRKDENGQSRCSQGYDLICQQEGEKLIYVTKNCWEYPLPKTILERVYQMVNGV